MSVPFLSFLFFLSSMNHVSYSFLSFVRYSPILAVLWLEADVY